MRFLQNKSTLKERADAILMMSASERNTYFLYCELVGVDPLDEPKELTRSEQREKIRSSLDKRIEKLWRVYEKKKSRMDSAWCERWLAMIDKRYHESESKMRQFDTETKLIQKHEWYASNLPLIDKETRLWLEEDEKDDFLFFYFQHFLVT